MRDRGYRPFNLARILPVSYDITMKLSGKERVLIIRLGSVGDVLRTLPAVSAFRSCYPEARIDWVVQDLSEDIVKSLPSVENAGCG